MATKLYAPNREYQGIAAGVQFRNGVAEVDEAALNPGATAYFRRSGFGWGAPAPTPEPVAVAGESPDARDHATSESVGRPLRDAAVDPRAKDFLAPTNAGEADPHGPLVVSPGIHAVGPAPIRPGPVAVGDPKQQDADETALAEAVLVERQDVGEATVAAAASSDPEGPPAASASKAAWVEFATAHGMDRDEAEDLTKAQLQERLG